MMKLDLSVVREIMKSLGTEVPGRPNLIAETFILAPMRKGVDPDPQAEHTDLLFKAGWIRLSRDIHMKGSDLDPVTYRPTPEGLHWVRRAWNDNEWSSSGDEARRVLKEATATK